MSITEEERVLGCLFGMACGDAMGVPSSFMTPDYIARTWGWIDTFLPPEKGHIFHDGLKAGEYTDDSEQAIALILLELYSCHVSHLLLCHFKLLSTVTEHLVLALTDKESTVRA